MVDENLGDANSESEESVSSSEKMLPQSHVNDLVGKAKLSERQRSSRELEKLRSEINELKNSRPAVGGMQEVNVDDIYNQVHGKLMNELRGQQEQAAQKQREQEMDRVANEFYGKISQGKNLYPDYDEVMSQLDISNYPNLVYLANGMDDTAHIMYELAKNPQKLANLSYLSERDPKAAKYGLGVLAKSIKENEDAKANAKNANAPLDRMQPSTTGSDNGQMTLRDLKRKYRV